MFGKGLFELRLAEPDDFKDFINSNPELVNLNFPQLVDRLERLEMDLITSYFE